MHGLMQDWPLTVDKILDHARTWHGHREVVTRSVEGPIVRTTYGALHARAKQVSNLLLGLGVKRGDRVGTLAWTTARHMEVWYGAMGIGAVEAVVGPSQSGRISSTWALSAGAVVSACGSSV